MSNIEFIDKVFVLSFANNVELELYILHYKHHENHKYFLGKLETKKFILVPNIHVLMVFILRCLIFIFLRGSCHFGYILINVILNVINSHSL